MNPITVKCPTCQVPFLIVAIALPGYIDNLDSEIANALASINAARTDHHASDLSHHLNNAASGVYIPLNADGNIGIDYSTLNAQHVHATSISSNFEENRQIAASVANIQGATSRNLGNPGETVIRDDQRFSELNMNDPDSYHNPVPSYEHFPTGYHYNAPSSTSNTYTTNGYHESVSVDVQTYLPNGHWQASTSNFAPYGQSSSESG